MSIELKMPALSPTMEEGTLSKWLVKEGDAVKSGDLLAEIETDKATMEFEAVDEGTLSKIVVPEGTDGVKVGAVIALIAGEGEDAEKPSPPPGRGLGEGQSDKAPPPAEKIEAPSASAAAAAPPSSAGRGEGGATPPAKGGDAPSPAPAPAAAQGDPADRIAASPLARRMAAQLGIDLATLKGSGPNGRIVKADLEGKGAPQAARPEPAADGAAKPVRAEPAATPVSPPSAPESEIPHEAVKLSNMRKVIARRLTESKQTVPHIYLTVDINLDRLLKLRGELNAGLAGRGVKLSVNDLLIKALAAALIEVPSCNVQLAGDQLLRFSRADISVAVSIPGGLITPVVVDAGAKSVSTIAAEIKALAERAREGKLQPHEYQGGTASLSNMGMYGIKQFEAVINPPQGMIMAIGAGEKRPYVVNDALAVATIMSATGSFDHRAIDGADGAALMQAFKRLVENPLGMLA